MPEIKAALAAENIQAARVRKLNLWLTVLIIVCMNIYPFLSIGHVMQKMARGLRFIWPDPEYAVVKDSALSYRRYQISPRVIIIDPDRLSFVHAIEVLKDAIPEFQMVAASQHDQLYHRLLMDIAHIRLPERRQRVNPRVVKRKMSNFLKKRAAYYDWPQPKVLFREAVSVI